MRIYIDIFKLYSYEICSRRRYKPLTPPLKAQPLAPPDCPSTPSPYLK